MYEEVQVKFYPFLNSALDGGQRSASHFDRFTPGAGGPTFSFPRANNSFPAGPKYDAWQCSWELTASRPSL